MGHPKTEKTVISGQQGDPLESSKQSSILIIVIVIIIALVILIYILHQKLALELLMFTCVKNVRKS